jgi:hypothetical protein
MVKQDLLHLSVNGYQLGSSFCQKGFHRGSVCIYVKDGQHFIKIDTLCYCKEQELEICAIQLETKSANLIMLSLYRAHLGDINEFLKRVDTILKCLYSPKSEYINYLNENNHKQINSLLKIYNVLQWIFQQEFKILQAQT